MNGTYRHNLETQKLELHFEKRDYDALPEPMRQEIKSRFLWSRSANAWVSRAKGIVLSQLWHPKTTAETLGLTYNGTEGERVSFGERVEMAQQRAEQRAERFEDYAENAIKRADQYAQALAPYRGDLSFFSQPILTGHGGSERFGRFRDRLFARYEKQFPERNKAKYYHDRAEIAKTTQEGKQYRDPGFLTRRIEDCEKAMRQLEKRLEKYPDSEDAQILFVEQIDRWQFYKACLDAAGGLKFGPHNISKGNYIKRWSQWRKVVRVNPKSVSVETDYSWTDTVPYTDIHEKREADAPALELEPI